MLDEVLNSSSSDESDAEKISLAASLKKKIRVSVMKGERCWVHRLSYP